MEHFLRAGRARLALLMHYQDPQFLVGIKADRAVGNMSFSSGEIIAFKVTHLPAVRKRSDSTSKEQPNHSMRERLHKV
jgi:hypothetical protein